MNIYKFIAPGDDLWDDAPEDGGGGSSSVLLDLVSVSADLAELGKFAVAVIDDGGQYCLLLPLLPSGLNRVQGAWDGVGRYRCYFSWEIGSRYFGGFDFSLDEIEFVGGSERAASFRRDVLLSNASDKSFAGI